MAAAAAEVRYRAARAVRGDRPMLVALAGVLVLGAIVLSGPAQSYLDARERLETLEVKAEALDDANATLEQRVADLNDPTSIELLAREQQGFVRPGEVAYSLIPPEVERPRITGPRHPALSDPDPWHERAWTVISGWFGA